MQLSHCHAGIGKAAPVAARLELGQEMRPAGLATLKFFALLFLLPGLAGLIVSSTISIHYLESMPKGPVMTESRVVPRDIHGTVVYQTKEENRRLSIIEYMSVGIFIVGLTLGMVYLEQWGAVQDRYGDEEELAENHL
jgi:hypothetical protein